MSIQNEFDEPEIHSELETIRHSAAHVMAHAISRIWPQAKFGIGPTVENGFYYDVELDVKLTPEDLPKIQEQMNKVMNENQPFVRSEHSIPEAIELFKRLNQPFKVEIIETLRDKMGATSVSTYKEGDFIDLCRGPHVAKAGAIKAVKLLSIAGAYWRGNEKNPQLQRIYGAAFLNKTDLHEFLQLQEEAKKRDHRKLGKELDLFSFHPEAPASPFFHAKGTVIYNRLTRYIRDLYAGRYEYDEIITPQIMDVALWKKSGHYDNYRESMYFTQIDEREFAVKPMNCPASTFVFASQKRSYRDLPIRLADFGRLHRYERSGVTAGLTRVRTFCQDDAHIFCTPEQIESEIKKTVSMIMEAYELFGFSVKIYLSTRPEKRTGDDALWDKAEAALKSVLDSLDRPYAVNPGDGAFYGPKIDFCVGDALKRYHQLGTIQLDFNMPERFDLSFTTAENTAERPVMVHRAVLGSLERFIGILTEHVAGAFPFWLAPVQARLVPIAEPHAEYCREFRRELKARGLRIDLDERNESMGLKTRESQMAKIPFTLVAGEREMQAGQFAVRRYGERESKVMTRDEILTLFQSLENLPHQASAATKDKTS